MVFLQKGLIFVNIVWAMCFTCKHPSLVLAETLSVWHKIHKIKKIVAQELQQQVSHSDLLTHCLKVTVSNTSLCFLTSLLLPSCVRSVSSRSMVALPRSSFLRVWQLHSFRSRRLWGVTLLSNTTWTHHQLSSVATLTHISKNTTNTGDSFNWFHLRVNELRSLLIN